MSEKKIVKIEGGNFKYVMKKRMVKECGVGGGSMFLQACSQPMAIINRVLTILIGLYLFLILLQLLPRLF